jgi:hypothetical protein
VVQRKKGDEETNTKFEQLQHQVATRISNSKRFFEELVKAFENEFKPDNDTLDPV